MSSAGVVQASNTRRAVPSTMRVTTSSRSDCRSTVVGSRSFFTAMALFLLFQCGDNLIQGVEPRFPKPAIVFEPCRPFLQSAATELAGAHAPDFLGDHEAGLLQNADVLLHAREGHVEVIGQVRDRGVATP